jgi:hypothetical protein
VTVSWLRRCLVLLFMGLGLAFQGAQAADSPQLDAQRGADGVVLNMDLRLDLPAGVEDALQKGVALHFVAEAELLRARWYWRDRRVASASRSWRLTFQPLTLKYRVSQGGLSQTFGSLREALGVIQRISQWHIADPLPADDEGRYYVEVRFKLDTTQLPRPLQLGLGSQPDWSLGFERTLTLPPPATAR